MKFRRLIFFSTCLGISIYSNRILSLGLNETKQLVLVLLSIGLLLVCIISMLSVHLTKIPKFGKTAIIIGWLITAVLSFEMLSSVINFKLRVDIAEGIQNTEFASVIYDAEGLLVLDGLIGPESASSLKKLLAFHGNKPLVINSGGGSLEAALEMADTVRDNEIEVIVTTECSSACVLVAIASNNLVALPETKFGFHQASIFGTNQSGMAKFWAMNANDSLMLALKRGGIPESILVIARRTPPEHIYYVYAEQMKSLGIVATILE